MRSILVRVDMTLLLDDERGRLFEVNPTPRDGWDAIPIELYRRHAVQGYFTRRLRRVAGFGREFMVDENWFDLAQVEAAMAGLTLGPRPWVPLALPEPKRRGCGCGERRG